MNPVILSVYREEWRFWRRSRLAGSALLLMAVMLLVSTAYTVTRGHTEADRRLQLQAQARAAFLEQPARHPHRMIHFGHYAFRAPVPLSALDPGIDPYTGMVIFLEGHRQNSAMFAEAAELASLSRFGSLSPAFVLQVLAPLLLVIMGFGSISREREQGTLIQLQASGVAAASLMAGKALALLAVAGLLLLPLGLAGLMLAAFGKASLLAVLAMLLAYGLYLTIWTLAVVTVSAMLRSSAAALAVLLLVWVLGVIALPKLASTLVHSLQPIPGKLETDLALLTDDTPISDGHDTAGAGVSALVAQILERYGAENVSDLPVNIRGLVSSEAEATATARMNQFAEQRMNAEWQQARRLDQLSFLSPLLAMRRVSMSLAGTDLPHQQRFLEEAEALRFDFVQSLNTLHARVLRYADDIRRSADPDAEQRTRVDADFWRLLPEFELTPAAINERLAAAGPMAAALLAWGLLALLLCISGTRRLRP